MISGVDSSLAVLLIILSILVIIIFAVIDRNKPQLDRKYFQRHWEDIIGKEDLSVAIVKADTLLGEALKRAGIKGGTVGERLNNAVGVLRDINGVWSAHKLRNKIVHEPDAKPTSAQCRKALTQFKKALRDLGAL